MGCTCFIHIYFFDTVYLVQKKNVRKTRTKSSYIGHRDIVRKYDAEVCGGMCSQKYKTPNSKLPREQPKKVGHFFCGRPKPKIVLYVSVCLPLKRSCFYLRMGNEYESISVRCIGFCGQLLGFEGQADGAIRHKRPDDAMVLLMLRQAGVVFSYCAKVRVNVEKLLNH